MSYEPGKEYEDPLAFVPFKHMTPELSDALMALREARNGNGLLIAIAVLPVNKPDTMHRTIAQFCNEELARPDIFDKTDRVAACTNIILLATALREHIKAGNVE
jgi:hypothetical protein